MTVPISAYPARIELLTQYAQVGALAAAAVLVVAVYCAWRASAVFGARRTVGLHRDDSAIASIEFLLVLMPLMSIVLVVIQLALMLNAQMNVAYSAYTAARSASTVAYMDFGGAEPEGTLSIGGQKWQKINRAAMPGVIAISPGSLIPASIGPTLTPLLAHSIRSASASGLITPRVASIIRSCAGGLLLAVRSAAFSNASRSVIPIR